MKYIILLGDGIADYPVEKLGYKTPLEVARIPNMDRIAGEGTIGLVDTIPEGFKPGSDVANLSVLGYDPGICYSGRGPLEAANMGVQIGPDDVAFRCNLVTLGPEADPVMVDYSAGHISSDEASRIIADMDKAIGTPEFQFYPGISYRHLLVWRNGKDTVETTPPHDITGQMTTTYRIKGNDAEKLVGLMRQSQVFLKKHPVNLARQAAGKRPATSIWLWGQGRAPRMVRLTDQYQLRGGVISAVDLLNGIGVCAGLEVIRVPGATGFTDTNYIGKAQAALKALKDLDFMFVHVEAPDEMGHAGNLEGKIHAIEDFDEKVVGTVIKGLTDFDDYRILVLSDHPTPLAIKTHASDPSPFAVLSSVEKENMSCGAAFSESVARAGGILVSPGYRLMNLFIRDWRRFIEEKRQ
ncbi:MAG: cofactor-independent phosphoglycerate mutase [Pseudomonadota bacterium]